MEINLYEGLSNSSCVLTPNSASLLLYLACMNEKPLRLLPGASGHGCCSHITSVSGPEISLILNVERNLVVCKTGWIFSDSPSIALGFDSTSSTIVNGNACPSKFGNN